MNQIMTYILQFVISGGVVVGMTALTRFVHPKFAALLYAIPLQFTLALLFLQSNTPKSTIQELSLATVYSLGITIVFVGVFYLLLKRFDFWLSLGFSFSLFLVLGFLLIKFL